MGILEKVMVSPRPQDFVDLYSDDDIVTVKISKFESTMSYTALRPVTVEGSWMLRDAASPPSASGPPEAPAAQEAKKDTAAQAMNARRRFINLTVVKQYPPPYFLTTQ